MSQYLPMEEMEVFKRFVVTADEVWRTVRKWDSFAKDTVGKQLVRSVDSVGANLVEGDGRHSDPDAVRFFRIARGSAREARYWITRATTRSLIALDVGERIIGDLTGATQMLNRLIAYRRQPRNPAIVREERAQCGEPEKDPFVDDEVDEISTAIDSTRYLRR